MLRLGIDIGGTKIIAGLLDADGKVIEKSKNRMEYSAGAAGLVPHLKQIVEKLLESSGREMDEVGFCGVGIPGTVSGDGKIAVKVPNLGWENFRLAQLMQDEFKIPVRLLQDSRAAAYGEYVSGGGAGCGAIVCMTLGTGIGTGIVIGGKIYNGELGCAGELGHVPVVPGGRKCGCGHEGCLECYSAGKGLEITAKELFGGNASSEELFERARGGDMDANGAISDAVEKLGTIVVSMTNLLSPDCVLFSGGLIRQRELFVEPLIDFVQRNRYRTDGEDEMYIGIATLGEEAPMIGAAMCPNTEKRMDTMLSASIMCADWLNLKKDLEMLETEGIEYLHCDIMDGHFVPNIMISPELMKKVRKGTSLPLDIHIMAENPENIVSQLSLRKEDIVAIHYESTVHVQRVLSQIKELGAIPAIAINPATPVETIKEVLCDVDVVLIMTVNPGYAGQKLVPQCIEKIRGARAMMDELGFSNIKIAVDGNCSFENIPIMQTAGAEIFVVGSSSLFSKDMGIKEANKKIRDILSKQKGK